MSDRILVVAEGEIVGELSGAGGHPGALPRAREHQVVAGRAAAGGSGRRHGRRRDRRRAGTADPVTRRLRALARRPEAGILLVILALGIFLSIANPRFLSIDNLMNIARNYSDIGIGAVGMTLVLLIGGIDLSVASVMALGGLVAAIAMVVVGPARPHRHPPGHRARARAIGLVNGLLIQRLRLPPFIATLGMLGVARGHRRGHHGRPGRERPAAPSSRPSARDTSASCPSRSSSWSSSPSSSASSSPTTCGARTSTPSAATRPRRS